MRSLFNIALWVASALVISSCGKFEERQQRRKERLQVVASLVKGEVPPPTTRDRILFHDGKLRRFSVVQPSLLDRSEKLPIVISFHGGGGDAEGQRATDRLDQLVNEKGFVLVYPNGIKRSWNAGECCGAAVKQNVDDVGFTKALIELVAKSHHGDKGRVYVTGLSNGAMMANRVACEMADDIAGFATVSGVGTFPACAPTKPVPTMHIHGTADQCATFEGGEAGNCLGDFFEKVFGTRLGVDNLDFRLSAPAHVAEWEERNGVAAQSSVTTYQHGDTRCETRAGGAGTAPVTFCTIDGGGHTWPGGTYGTVCNRSDSRLCREFKKVSGKLTNDFDASRKMLEFFFNP